MSKKNSKKRRSEITLKLTDRKFYVAFVVDVSSQPFKFLSICFDFRQQNASIYFDKSQATAKKKFLVFGMKP